MLGGAACPVSVSVSASSLTDNQRLFQSLGYREISREAHPGFDYPTSINMRKSLV